VFKKLTGSLAYRLPLVYRKLLWLKPLKTKGDKVNANQVVLMMTGRHHLGMTRLAMLSIANSWKKLPRLMVSTDGSMSAAALKKKLSFWPGKLDVYAWEETSVYHAARGRRALLNYAKAHPFGKKMALILHYAELGPVLWVDSDILFFDDFIKHLPATGKGFACGGTEDFTAAYHQPVLQWFNNDLFARYKFNAGILLVSGTGIYEDFGLEGLLDSIGPDYDFCTEQSIFAHIASQSLGILWSRDVVRSFNDDNQSLVPMRVNGVIARHYTTNVRHLFWRDAFFNL